MLRALIFDSFFDKHRGVIAYIRVFSGSVSANQNIYFLATETKALCQEVGFFYPEMRPAKTIENGEVGYLITGLKGLEMVKVGDTIADLEDKNLALPGYQEIIPKVFAGFFPIDSDQYEKLRDSLAKIKLSDASLIYVNENIPAIGFGFRCGFLGLLHMEIIQERLKREFDLDLVVTTPSVKYRVVPKQNIDLKQEQKKFSKLDLSLDKLKQIWQDEMTYKNIQSLF